MVSLVSVRITDCFSHPFLMRIGYFLRRLLLRFFDPSISRAGHRVPKSFVFFYCVCVLFLNDQSEIRTENREMAEG